MKPTSALVTEPLLPRENVNCMACGLYRGCHTWKIGGRGDKHAKLVLLGEAPGETEDAKGRPFVGRAGKLLDKLLKKAGIGLDTVFITNAVRCRPTEHGENRKPTPKEMELCFPFLEEEMRKVSPAVIVPLGNTACQALLKLSGVEKLRGRDYAVPRFGCRAVPTYHPAAALRDSSREQYIVQDLRLAKRVGDRGTSSPQKEGDYRVLTTLDLVEQSVKRVESGVGRVAVDWETASKDEGPDITKPLGVGFSWKPGTGVYVPYMRRIGTALVPFWGDNQAKIRKMLSRALMSDTKKVTQFGKFDRKVTELNICPFGGEDFDTGLASYLIDENSSHKLENLALQFTDMGAYKRDVEVFSGKRGSSDFDLSKVPLEELGTYCAKDCDATLRLYYEFRPELIRQGLWLLFSKIVMPLSGLLAEAELRGIRVNPDRLKKEIRRWEDELEKTRGRILAFKEASDLNVDSPLNMQELLFNRLALRLPRRARGKLSTDKHVLEEMRSQHPVVPLLLEYRKNSKLISTYGESLLSFLDSRNLIHTDYLIHGTRTGRLSSSDPNLQNLPKNRIRSAFIPRDGFVFLLTDFSQVELRGLAYYSRDPALLEAYKKGLDIHRRTAAAVFEKKEDEVIDEERQKGKVVNFGVVYGLTPVGLANLLSVSPRTSERYLDRFWGRYEVAYRWKRKFIETTRRRGYYVNVFGRRRRHPDLDSSDDKVREAAEREVVNNYIQGTCSGDIPNFAAVRTQRMLRKKGLRVHFLLNEHDGLIFEAHKDDVGTAIPLIKREMERPPVKNWDVPLVVDCVVSDSLHKSK